MFKGKKGGEKIISIWWFITLGLIGGGIVTSIYMYYGMNGDVREYQSKVLAERVLECISEGDSLNKEIFTNTENFILNKCQIKESSDIILSISFSEESKETIVYGNPSLIEDCKLMLLKKSQLSESFPRCFISKAKLYYENKLVEIEIMFGIKPLGGRE